MRTVAPIGTLIAGALSLFLLGTSALAQELVFNGGFETGNFAGWSVPPNIFPPNSNAQYFSINANGGASGTYYALLSSTELRFISQIVPTVAGQDYELTFWLKRTDNFPAQFQVRWEGQVVYNSSAPLPDNVNWHLFTVPLRANFNGSFIEFGQRFFPAYHFIDDISVLPAPSPAPAALLLMGGAAALRRHRRR